MATGVSRGIAAYQMLAGGWGLVDPARSMFNNAHTGGQYTLAALVTALMLASVVAGVLLWTGSSHGRALSRTVQALQVPVLASKWFVYSVTLGLACLVSLRGPSPTIWLGLGPHITIGVTPLTYVPQMGINFVPLILWHLLRKSVAPTKDVDRAVVQAA